MLNTDSRRRSAVGRISREDGEARLRPFNRPPTTRINGLLVPRLVVALAVIAALRAAKRTVGYADEPVHLETEMRHHVAHLAVLAFADRKHQPDIGALVVLQRRIDR